MTVGEKHTADAAGAVLKLLAADDRQAVLAWVDDRERAARSTAVLTGGLVVAARGAGVVAGISCFGVVALWLLAGCPECAECSECPAAQVPLEWAAPRDGYGLPGGLRGAVAEGRRCAALDDAVLCVPTREPSEVAP